MSLSLGQMSRYDQHGLADCAVLCCASYMSVLNTTMGRLNRPWQRQQIIDRGNGSRGNVQA